MLEFKLGCYNTCGVVGSLITGIPTTASLEHVRVAMGIVPIGFIEAHVLGGWSGLRSSGNRGHLA